MSCHNNYLDFLCMNRLQGDGRVFILYICKKTQPRRDIFEPTKNQRI